MKTIALLGSTGSIGRNVLDVVARNPGRFKLVALAAGRNIRLLYEQINHFSPRVVSVIDEEHARLLSEIYKGRPPVEILYGQEGYRHVATLADVTVVVSAMVGAAGLVPTWEAIKAGKEVALANKETLVVAGELIMREVQKRGVRLIPVDSEHSAIFQCLAGNDIKNVRRIILTASGGPFLNTPAHHLSEVKPSEALKHPNWQMGAKITVDSATMMNKGLEIIEARWLFSMSPEKIEVVIHPQSIVHSIVEFVDGSFLAQMGKPDMKIPISYALFYPERMNDPSLSLDFSQLGSLTFLPPDEKKFPCLRLAKEALKEGGVMPAVMNAANEIAVEGFLTGKIKFTDIFRVISEVMERFSFTGIADSLDAYLISDDRARRLARKKMDEIAKGGVGTL